MCIDRYDYYSLEDVLIAHAGEIPCENSLLRQVSSLLRRLPAIESGKFQDDFLMVSSLFSLTCPEVEVSFFPFKISIYMLVAE